MACTMKHYYRHYSNTAAEINEIFQWIIDHDPLVQRKLVLEKLGKTYLEIGKWLLEHETFTSWLEYGDSSSDQYGLKLLWLHGPGRNNI